MIKYYAILTQLALNDYILETSSSLSKTYIELCKLLYSLQIYSYPFTTPALLLQTPHTMESKDKAITNNHPLTPETQTIEQYDSDNHSLNSISLNLDNYSSSSGVESGTSIQQSLINNLIDNNNCINTYDKCINILNISLFTTMSYKSNSSTTSDLICENNHNLSHTPKDYPTIINLKRYALQVASLAFNQLPLVLDGKKI